MESESHDAGIGIRIGIKIFGQHWNRNQNRNWNRNHGFWKTLESESESESTLVESELESESLVPESFTTLNINMIYSTPLLCWAKSVHAKAYACFRTAEIGNIDV